MECTIQQVAPRTVHMVRVSSASETHESAADVLRKQQEHLAGGIGHTLSVVGSVGPASSTIHRYCTEYQHGGYAEYVTLTPPPRGHASLRGGPCIPLLIRLGEVGRPLLAAGAAAWSNSSPRGSPSPWFATGRCGARSTEHGGEDGATASLCSAAPTPYHVERCMLPGWDAPVRVTLSGPGRLEI